MNERDLPIALVTGATRGLGAAVAVALADPGRHLVLTGRNVGALEEVDDAVRKAGGLPATLVPLDLTEGAQIDQLGLSLYQRFGRLDVLASCAGTLGALSPVGHLEPAVWQASLALNLDAAWRLIRSLDPLLRLAPAGRAVFLTCAAARNPKAYWGASAAAKAGLEALVRCYAAELGKTAVKVNLVDPGPMATQLRARAYPGEDPTTLPKPEDKAAALLPLLSPKETRCGALVDLRDVGAQM